VGSKLWRLYSRGFFRKRYCRQNSPTLRWHAEPQGYKAVISTGGERDWNICVVVKPAALGSFLSNMGSTPEGHRRRHGGLKTLPRGKSAGPPSASERHIIPCVLDSAPSFWRTCQYRATERCCWCRCAKWCGISRCTVWNCFLARAKGISHNNLATRWLCVLHKAGIKPHRRKCPNALQNALLR